MPHFVTIHSLVGKVVSTFWLLQIVRLQTFTCRYLLECLFPIIWSSRLRAELLGSMPAVSTAQNKAFKNMIFHQSTRLQLPKVKDRASLFFGGMALRSRRTEGTNSKHCFLLSVFFQSFKKQKSHLQPTGSTKTRGEPAWTRAMVCRLRMPHGTRLFCAYEYYNVKMNFNFIFVIGLIMAMFIENIPGNASQEASSGSKSGIPLGHKMQMHITLSPSQMPSSQHCILRSRNRNHKRGNRHGTPRNLQKKERNQWTLTGD